MIFRLPAIPANDLHAGATATRKLPLLGLREFRVLSAETQRLTDVTQRAARAEGYASRSDWKAGWVRTHDRAWRNRQPHAPSNAACVRRFDSYWATRMSVVLHIAVIDKRVLYMPTQDNVLSGRTGQYTTNGAWAIDRLAVIDPAALERYTAEATDRAEQDRVARRLRRLERHRARVQRRRPGAQP